jgi:RimJ/RimL family protein N-acetyltransferase
MGLELVGCVAFSFSGGSGKSLFSALMSERFCGSGIAARLFDVCYGKMMNWCPGCYVHCNVSTRNVRSTRYVQKCGFVPTGKVDGEMVEYVRKVG